MNTLTAPQVRNKMQENPNVQLVMTLSPQAFAKCHIPMSINIWDIEMVYDGYYPVLINDNNQTLNLI